VADKNINLGFLREPSLGRLGERAESSSDTSFMLSATEVEEVRLVARATEYQLGK
jgi:hypothetical protein